MASYDETILAKTPQFYGELEELVGFDLIDSSGNGFDGTYLPDAVFGRPGPIETDASSVAVGGEVGVVEAPSGGALDFRDGWTWEGWGISAVSGIGSAIVARNQGFTQNGSNVLGFAPNGTIKAEVSSGPSAPETHILTYSDTALGSFYHVVLTRNGVVLQLCVNGVLVAEDSTFIAGPLVYAAYNISDWNIGVVNAGAGGYQQGGNTTSHIALYNYPLSASEKLENYEAAINALLLHGYSNVIPSAILYSDIEPDPVSFPFRHNWSDSLIERISFQTDISTARKGSEESNGARPKPRREIEISQVLRDDAERRKLRAKLWANQNRKWFIPILEDREQLTSSLSAGATTVPVSAQYKDYEINSWVELRQLNNAGQVVKFENALISALSPLTFSPTVNAYDAYLSTISPARRAIARSSIPVRGHTDAVEDLTITARLIPEDESTTPNRITPWTPTLTYKTFEVFDPLVWQSNDWTETREYDIDRDIQDVDFGTGSFSPESDTPGAAEATSYRMTLEGRDKIAALLGWFYYRAGSLIYVWVPTMQKDFAIVSVVGSTVTVSAHEYFDNYAGSEARRDLAFVYFDNTMTLRRISSVALAGVNETLTLDSAAPTQTNLRSVSFLKFCRLDGDSLEIARMTDNKARFAWRFRELLSSPS